MDPRKEDAVTQLAIAIEKGADLLKGAGDDVETLRTVSESMLKIASVAVLGTQASLVETADARMMLMRLMASISKAQHIADIYGACKHVMREIGCTDDIEDLDDIRMLLAKKGVQALDGSQLVGEPPS